MPEGINIKKSTLAVIGLVIVVLGIIAWVALTPTYYVAPPKYTTGLTVKFKVYDTATYTLLDTGDVSPEFYPAGTTPLSVRTFTTKPTAVGAYYTVGGYWTVPLLSLIHI